MFYIVFELAFMI